MADEYQYIKMPDGSYGKFRADISDDVIRGVIAKDFPDAFKNQQGTIGPAPSALRRAGNAAFTPSHMGADILDFHPLNALSELTKPIENYTQEGRAAHPFLSKLGDTWRNAKDWVDMASTEASLLAAPLMGEDIVAAGRGAFSGAGASNFSNNAASALRYPATARQSQLGRPGTVKPFLPAQLQRYTIPDWAIPKGEVGTPTNPGPFMDIPAKMPKPIAPAEIPAELGSPENPGWMSKIPNRMPKPAEAPPDWQAPTHTEIPLGSPEYPGPFSKIPNRLPSSMRGDPFSPQAAAETPPRVVPYSSGEPRFTGNEGRAATWTNEAVMRLASQGNREAISQAVRRGLELPPGARYVMGDPDFSRAIYNPREVTQFTPEGQPIRNVENPTQQAPRERIQVPPNPPEAREVTNAATGEVTSPFASQRRTLERGVVTPYDLPSEGEVLSEQIRQSRGSVLNRPKISEGEALNQIMRDPDAYAKYKLADKKTRDAMLVQVARGKR